MSLKFGVAIPNYGRTPSKRELIRVSTLVEELEYDSIFTTDHTLMAKPFAYPYGNIFETFTTLSYIAARTSSVKIGTSILSLPLRNPLHIAKQVATLDVLSEGRMILGVGVGGGEDDIYEFKYLNADYLNRGRYANESLKVIRTLWTSAKPEFRGEFFNFSDCIFLPKPLQRPHPPIWIAGASRAALMRASEYGDAWHPTGIPPLKFLEGSRLLEKLASKGRRSRRSKKKGIARSGRYLVRILKDGEKMIQEPFHTIQGSPRKVAVAVQEFVDAGMEHLVCYFGDDGARKTEERIRIFAREIAPSF